MHLAKSSDTPKCMQPNICCFKTNSGAFWLPYISLLTGNVSSINFISLYLLNWFSKATHYFCTYASFVY